MFDPRKDFIIHCKLRQVGGVKNYGYGLVLKDVRDSRAEKRHYFHLSSNAYYKLYTYDYKTRKSIEHQAWTQNKEIVNSIKKYNSLRVEKQGKQIRFYINDNLVKTLKNIEFWGTFLGFSLNRKMDVEVDYLEVRQDNFQINLVANAQKGYTLEKLGPEINTKYSDLRPVISPDGQTLYFLRKEHPGNAGVKKRDDIWVSQRQADGTWSQALNLGKPINNENSNSVISVPPDGNSLLISNTYKSDGSYAGPGISIARRGANGWRIPEPIEVKDYLNHNKYINYCLSSDQKVLISSVERNDTYGEQDLYVSFRINDTTFPRPVNMGPEINTLAADVTPFLAPDNVSLYFSSAGHPGYGRNDIYVSRRLDDTWIRWTKPENLGPEINSKAWDAYFTLAARGDLAYLVKGGDIYRIPLTESARPQPVVLIKGVVKHQDTGQPLEARISYYDLEANAEAGIAYSNPETGAYSIILPYGKKYSFRASQGDYFAISQNVDLSGDSAQYVETQQDLELVPVEVGRVLRLKSVFFDFNKAELLPESYNELDQLVNLLQENPKIQIEIGGHTDHVGADYNNLVLSQKRVKSVLGYLLGRGIAESRMLSKGYGETKPIADNQSEEGRQTNRRVEFTILSK